MATRRPTSRDVARLAGVSQTAVSFVFNDHADGNLSDETRQRILDAAHQLAYRPSPIARSLRRQSTVTLGLVTDHIASSPFAGPVLRGAMQRAWEREHLLLVVDSVGDAEREDAAVEELLGRRVDGIVYAAMSLRRVRVPKGLDQIPSILVNCVDVDGAFPAVIPDERAGGRAAVQILLDAGHRQIAHIAGRRRDMAAEERIRGFRDGARAAGLRLPASAVRRTGWEIDEGFDAAVELLSENGTVRGDRVSGVVCANDRVAVGVMQAAIQLGLCVPRDVSVVGYDDQESLADRTRPALTTVALPHYAMGDVAVDMLLDAVAAGRPLEPSIRLLPCPVVMRSSVGPAATR